MESHSSLKADFAASQQQFVKAIKVGRQHLEKTESLLQKNLRFRNESLKASLLEETKKQ